MASATDWQNIAVQMRQKMQEFAALELDFTALKNYYDKNSGLEGDYLGGIGSNEPIADSGITKNEFILGIYVVGALKDFLDNVAVSASDRRQSVEQIRSTD